MTKKFWADWQRRIGETKNIYLFSKYLTRVRYGHYLLNENCEDSLINASFHGDVVDLVIQRKTWCFNHVHVENEYLTLHRIEIANIKFIKYEY
jgi:hypothetical protein